MGGFTSFLLLLCVGVTVSKVLDLQKRIEGGEDCQRQYHVKILNRVGKDICIGSLLENNWILTTTHCWTWRMKVVVGGQEPVEITAPPHMYGDENNMLHDIMLVKLPNDPKTESVKLPNCESDDLPKTVKQVRVAGYEGTNKETLKCADMTISPCEGIIKHPEPKKYIFCGKTSGVKMCRGDSGGGVVFNGVIYGVHKASVKETEECAPSAAFMNVCRYKTWIEKIIVKK